MEKVYRLLTWLDIVQAVDWLQDLTATDLTERDLLALCAARRCTAYANTDGFFGHDFDDAEVEGQGIHQVRNPLRLIQAGTTATAEITFEGPVFIDDAEDENADGVWALWRAVVPLRDCSALFRPEDIQALAGVMNGVGMDGERTELEDLRQQLEQERAARQAAERRAEQAEAETAALRQQLAAVGTAGSDGAGLTFPYATKHLEAARAAALEYWQEFDPVRPPLQKQVIASIVSMGVPVRQAEELARAIKRGDLHEV